MDLGGAAIAALRSMVPPPKKATLGRAGAKVFGHLVSPLH